MRFGLIILILLATTITGVAWWATQVGPENILTQTNVLNNTVGEVATLLNPGQFINTPGPLEGTSKTTSGDSTAATFFNLTNLERTKRNLTPLRRNKLLEQAAATKIEDMIARNYFEHVNPSGKGPADFIIETTYNPLASGENLASGQPNAANAIAGLMDSPGHKANILSTKYTELGVATGTRPDGTPLYVQMFGRPASECPAPPSENHTLQTTYETKKIDYEQAIDVLEQFASDIESLEADIATRTAQVNADIIKANNTLREGNSLIEQGNTASQNGNNEKAEQLWSQGEAKQAEGQSMHAKIEQDKNTISQIQSELEKTVQAHNEQINVIRTKEEALKTAIDQLNTAIRNYNTCLEG